ncbi:hypothetical protein AB4076_21510, partial [Dyella sp. 2RAF44]|uniref:hypothetical protein n=1 Tax=Dyella sp. 2RAF44 TaxID=3233000 RepID=UPI003F8EC40A
HPLDLEDLLGHVYSDARKLHGWTPLRQRLVLIASSLALDAEDGEESISLLWVESGPNAL